MSRVIAIALLLAPVLATAQATPADGEVTFSDSLLGATDCTAARADFKASWNVTLDATLVSVPANATFTIYAATVAPTAATSGTTKCTDASGSKVIEGQEQIAVSGGSDSLTLHPLDTTKLVAAVAAGCSATDADKDIFVCVQLFDASSTRVAVGIATGKVTLSTQKPGTPTNLRVSSGDQALNIDWDPPATGHAVANYEVVVSSTEDPDSPRSSGLLGSSTETFRIDHLLNTVPYKVEVFAYTASGTKSDAAVMGPNIDTTPLVVQDFWDWYTAQSGAREQGGCGTGAGTLSLLGAAAFLVARRRR